MEYVATFFSHYDALMFVKALQASGLAGKATPVPRRISSSCGTGVRFETDGDVTDLAQEGLDKIYRSADGEYGLVLDHGK